MSWPERIECENFSLRPWRMDDVESLVRHASDPAISRGLGRHPYPYTDEDAYIFISEALHLPHKRRYAIEINGEASGAIGLHQGEDIEQRSAQVGYWLGRAYWHQGIVSEAVAALLPHAWREWRLYRLHASAFPDNRASIRVLEKCGFVHEATLRRSAVKDDRVLDMLIYAITRESPESPDAR